MPSDLGFYPLACVLYILLCLLLCRLWRGGNTTSSGRKPPRPTREPKPFAGLTRKPDCEACAQQSRSRGRSDIPHVLVPFHEYSPIQSRIRFAEELKQLLMLLGKIHHDGVPLPRDAEHMNPDKSNCDFCQAQVLRCPSQCVGVLTIAFRLMRSVRMVAVRATCCAFPRARSC
jgi:hypothetical protein